MKFRDLPSWERINDDDLQQWLNTLPDEEQRKLAGQTLDKLEHARGDALMADAIALRPLRIPFPDGWETWTDEEKCLWWNGPYREKSWALIAADQAARQAAAEGLDR